MNDAPPFTDERYSRLRGACLGAPALELVTVRAGDLISALGRCDAIDQAVALLGENAKLTEQLAVTRSIAAQVPLLRDRIAALEADKAALRNRISLGIGILRGSQVTTPKA